MSHAREPETVTGAREPRSARAAAAERLAAERGTGAPGVQPSPDKPGKRIFAFIAAKYQVLLTAPQDLNFADGRIVKGEKSIKVVSVPAAIGGKWKGWAVLDLVKDARAIELLLEHTSYGVDFVDYETIVSEQRNKRIAEATDTFVGDKDALKDPSVRERLYAALSEAESEEFADPAKQVSQPSA